MPLKDGHLFQDLYSMYSVQLDINCKCMQWPNRSVCIIIDINLLYCKTVLANFRYCCANNTHNMCSVIPLFLEFGISIFTYSDNKLI